MKTFSSIRDSDRVSQRLPFSRRKQRNLGAVYAERVPTTMTLEQVATMMGLTRQRVQQIEIDALNHLRYWIEGLDGGTLTMEDLRAAQAEQRRNPGARTFAKVLELTGRREKRSRRSTRKRRTGTSRP